MTNEEVVHLRKANRSELAVNQCLPTEICNSPSESDANDYSTNSRYNMVKNQDALIEKINSKRKNINIDEENGHNLEEEKTEEPPRTKLRISSRNYYTETPVCNVNCEIGPLSSPNLNSKYSVIEVDSEDGESFDDDFADTFSGPEPKAPKIRQPWMTPHNTTQYIFAQHENDPVDEHDSENVFGYSYWKDVTKYHLALLG